MFFCLSNTRYYLWLCAITTSLKWNKNTSLYQKISATVSGNMLTGNHNGTVCGVPSIFAFVGGLISGKPRNTGTFPRGFVSERGGPRDGSVTLIGERLPTDVTLIASDQSHNLITQRTSLLCRAAGCRLAPQSHLGKEHP